MKTVIVAGAVILGAYFLWLYTKQGKASTGGCGCSGDAEQNNEVCAPKNGSEDGKDGDVLPMDVRAFETSPLKTFNTPSRLLPKSIWPTDMPQTFSRG